MINLTIKSIVLYGYRLHKKENIADIDTIDLDNIEILSDMQGNYYIGLCDEIDIDDCTTSHIELDDWIVQNIFRLIDDRIKYPGTIGLWHIPIIKMERNECG